MSPLLGLGALTLSACSVGPDYQPPHPTTPAAFNDLHSAERTASQAIGIYTFIVIPVITLQNDFNLSVGGIDSRLTRRYQTLVKQHMT
uniref:hypothetical protein n=1 Tax=Candidatus Sodalis sp. SoCistrobi TaxID=1922216 RepID=UPI0015750A37